MKRRFFFFVTGLLAVLFLFVFVRRPIMTGNLTKQTLYLWLLNSFHIKDNHRTPTFMLIDDDSGTGIYIIHEICERIGVKATFAVVPAILDSTRCDLLKAWHKDGYGIALHGYNHGRWKEWTYNEIVDDIQKSIAFMEEHEIASSERIRMVVTPGSSNTYAIRKAINNQGMKMVMGANVINPDTTTFQYGRMFITQETDLTQVRDVLECAKAEKGFVIFGTHSSNSDEFSEDKTESVLRMAVEMGFKLKN